jgi:hypothetical protein
MLLSLGPFETDREAVEAVRNIYDISATRGAWAEPNYDLLIDACAQARVVLGEYDAQILRWLAGFEPATCAVVAGLVSRAYPVGRGKS